MNVTKPVLVSAALVGGMAAASVWANANLPDQPLPVHFGISGAPDRFWPKERALALMPILAGALAAGFAVIPALMPANARLERSAGVYQTVWLLTLALLAVSHGVVIAAGAGLQFDVRRPILCSIGVLLLVLGNLMPKTRYNYVLGVRTPWTLADERVWDRTHRFMGPVFMAWGALAILLGLFAIGTPEGQRLTAWAMPTAAAVTVALALGYSYLASRRVGSA